MNYNITQNILKDGYGHKEEITPEKFNFILEKLKEATELAKTITINKMKKAKKTRKLKKKMLLEFKDKIFIISCFF